MSKKENKPSKPRVHKELNGFEVSINQFGELQSNMNIEKINTFLDKNVDDKKLLEKEEKERLRNEKKKK
ncbi:MAG: hypothetical protein ACKO96_18140 [Flammeovirgaceae bacterium]